MSYLTMVLAETKAYYSEDESARRERGTRDGLPFTVLIPDRHNADISSLQSEFLARMGKRLYLSAIQAPKAVRPSSVAPPVLQGSCVIVNSCRSLMLMPSGQGHQEAGPHVIRSPRSVHPFMKFVRLFFSEHRIEG